MLSVIRISWTTHCQRLQFGIAAPPAAVVVEQILSLARKAVGQPGLLHHAEGSGAGEASREL